MTARETIWEEAMELAIAEAREAAAAGEVPVGAVLIVPESSGRGAGMQPPYKVLSRGRNRTRELCDASAHAEILALREAEKNAGDFRLDHLGDVVSVSTIEPCLMCLGALSHARVRRVVFGIRDEKFGGLYGRFGLRDHPTFSQWEVAEGVMADECATLLKDFFADKR